MLEFLQQNVSVSPFPHVTSTQVLDPELFTRLKADFPGSQFESQNEISGSAGSRTGGGTGFDIYRGDTEYDRLISTSPAWSEFDAYINSRSFIELFLHLFGGHLDDAGCAIKVSPAMYDRSLVEARSALSTKLPSSRGWRGLIGSANSAHKSEPKLFTRLDIERSLEGYAKPPHCDRENRLASLIIYFTDQQDVGLQGGELNIYEHKQRKKIEKYERHPKPANVNCVATLPVKKNFGIFFPCSNNSYHGVNQVKTPGIARDFLYINISADADKCWY